MYLYLLRFAFLLLSVILVPWFFLFLNRDILTGKVLTEYNKRKTSNAYKIAEVDQDTLFNNMKRRQLTVI